MEHKKDTINNFFKSLEGSWDTEMPAKGHQDRFLDRLEGNKKKKTPWLRLAMPVAAAIALLLAIYITYEPDTPAPADTMQALSPKARETQQYFTTIIEKEIAKVESENSPETKKLVQDALFRMRELEKDYDRLTQELIEKGESKKIIHAMITNLQTRISFLEEVLTRIENIKKIKENYHENNQA